MSCVETFAIYCLRNGRIYDAKCTSPMHPAQFMWFAQPINTRPRRTYKWRLGLPSASPVTPDSNLLSSELWTKLCHQTFQITQNIKRWKADCLPHKELTMWIPKWTLRPKSCTYECFIFLAEEYQNEREKKKVMRRVRHTSGQPHPLSHRPAYVHTDIHGHRQGYPTNRIQAYVPVTEHLVRSVYCLSGQDPNRLPC
jgi:hypothetical protein